MRQTLFCARPQNRRPDALVQSRRALAQKTYNAVRVALQAMRLRDVHTERVTVQAVAEESGVSVATLYRRDDLFKMIQALNPTLQRRRREQYYRDQIDRAQREVEAAQADALYQSRLANATAIQDRRTKQELVEARKRILELERQLHANQTHHDASTPTLGED